VIKIKEISSEATGFSCRSTSMAAEEFANTVFGRLPHSSQIC
jgi:hypothetical protein